MADEKLCDLIPGEYYHIYNRAHGDELMFRDPWNYGAFLMSYKKRMNPYVRTMAYCLLSNHFHLLVRIKSLDEIEAHEGGIVSDVSSLISRQFSNLFVSYTKSYNNLYHRKGGLFMHRFKRKHVENDEQLMTVFVYIHRNPIHHFVVKRLSTYLHSSYNAYRREQSTWVEIESMTAKFGPAEMKKMLFASELPMIKDIEEI